MNYCELFLILPEILIFASSLLIILLGIIKQKGRFLTILSLIFVALAFGAACFSINCKDNILFSQLYISDGFAKFAKLVILLLLAIILIISREHLKFCEYFALLLLVTLGMVLAVSANNIILLYLSLELQSLALYILVAIEKDKAISLEAGGEIFYFKLCSICYNHIWLFFDIWLYRYYQFYTISKVRFIN